jgi:hypothetical protein
VLTISCVRSKVLILLFLIAGATLALGQGTTIRSEYGLLIRQDPDQTLKREVWFRHGRVVPGQSSAALRYRAHVQKMQLRATRAASARAEGPNAHPHDTSTTRSTSLGPKPLASDASGFGVQDYGWVSGRVTAVAVAPADGTGDTVYIGEAYGGVWNCW